MALAEEMVTLVDEHDNVIGSKRFSQLTDTDRWRIADIWVEDKAGNVLITKRKMDKKTMPGRWEPGTSGTVDHPSRYEEVAVRELDEELGIKRDDLKLEAVIFFKSTFGSRASGLFKVIVDRQKEKIKFQVEEIDEVKWVSPEELVTDVRSYPDKYVVSIRQHLEHFLDD